MRIAIDVRDLRIAKTGSRTYLEELCRVLPESTDRHQFIFLTPRWNLPTGNAPWHKIWGHFAFYFWKEIELPWRAWREQCEIVFCTDYVVPLIFPGDTMPVFHGANFWERPQDYNRFWHFLLDVLALPAARRSVVTITVSEFSKRRLVSLTGISPDRLHVVYEAPKSVTLAQHDQSSRENVLDKYGLENRQFLLHVGVLEKRKNLPRLIEAFALAKQQLPPEYSLVLVGQPGPKQNMDDSQLIEDTIQRHGVQDSVVLTGYVSDGELPVFYQRAKCYVFPSLYEGFGLPILEAFANDLPLVAANAASIPEIAGDAALLFDPYNVKDMARQIVRAVNEESLRKNLIEAGRQRMDDFSWGKTAQEIISVMELVVEKRSVEHD